MDSPLLTARKGVRRHTVLVFDTIWYTLKPTRFSTCAYLVARDHRAMAAVFGSSIKGGDGPREYTGSVHHGHAGTFNAFQKHMT